MTKKNVETGSLKFSIDASLLFQLGEQLVAKPSIALAELVKNAYDADATRVTITMENVGAEGGTILIEDDGHGMTFEEMRRSWMRIATTAKRDNPQSRTFHRSLTGAKGIGRFAARRLGNRLVLRSIAQIDDGSKELITADFDWQNSFSAGEDLAGIPISYSRQWVAPESPTGVCLNITGARDAWTPEEVSSLRRDLLSLQSPFPDLVVRAQHANQESSSVDPGFNIELIINNGTEELQKLSGGLGDSLLQAAWARLDGIVDDKGRAHYDITILRSQEHDNLIDDSNDYFGLENARLRVYFMLYTPSLFSETDFGVRDAQRKGREEGGIRVYLDGFRVFPYGDPGDDWLQLDQYSAKNIDMGTVISPPERVKELAGGIPGRPYLLIPKNNQVFGMVAISQTQHRGVETNVSRERLIETPTVVGLRRFAQNGLYWMALKHAASMAEERMIIQTRKQTVAEIIRDALDVVRNLSDIQEEKRQIVSYYLSMAMKQSEEEQEERISEISMLRVLASAGTTITLMNHQLQALIGAVSQTEQDLRRLRPHVPEQAWEQYDDIIQQVSEWHDMVNLQVSQLGFLLSPDSRQRRRRHALREVVENVKKPLSYYINKYGVQFDNKVPSSLRSPPIYQSELYSVLINIFSNALKAVYGQRQRSIAVEARRANGVLHLRLMDTGVGLPAERREVSFKPFVTTSMPNPILGVGTGIGLKVVRDILELYGGTARFVDIDAPWKTCIEITLPEGEIHGND